MMVEERRKKPENKDFHVGKMTPCRHALLTFMAFIMIFGFCFSFSWQLCLTDFQVPFLFEVQFPCRAARYGKKNKKTTTN